MASISTNGREADWASIFSIPSFRTSTPSNSMGVHEKVFGFHRLLSRRFPWAIYYDVLGDRARVYAVLDCRQSPERSVERLYSDSGGK